jgi:hypothetical protein
VALWWEVLLCRVACLAVSLPLAAPPRRSRGLLRETAVVRSLGTPELKGKSRPVEVFELLALRTDWPLFGLARAHARAQTNSQSANREGPAG